MTNMQRVFIEEYLVCWNATKAAKRVGYKFPNTQGPRLLVNVGIAAEIKRRMAEKAMCADEVLLRLAHQARGDLADFSGVKSIRDLAQNNKSHIVKKIKTTQRNTKDDSEITTFEIELYSAQAALVHIGKHHDLFADKYEHSGKVDIVEMTLEEWQQQQTKKRQQAQDTLADFEDSDE